MKILITDANSIPVEFNIDVVLSYIDDIDDISIAASTHRGYELPDGPLMPPNKDDAVTEQQIIDYETFLQDVIDFLEDNCELQVIYKNKSPDRSLYRTFLAKDDKGNLLFKFKTRLRVSTHDPHRTEQQQANKKAEEKSTAHYFEGKKKPRKMTKIITVNSEKYISYFEAFADICDTIDNCLEVMKR